MIHNSDNVDNILGQIQHKFGYQPSCVRLIYNGKRLTTEKGCDIAADGVLHAVPWLRGAGKRAKPYDDDQDVAPLLFVPVPQPSDIPLFQDIQTTQTNHKQQQI